MHPLMDVFLRIKYLLIVSIKVSLVNGYFELFQLLSKLITDLYDHIFNLIGFFGKYFELNREIDKPSLLGGGGFLPTRWIGHQLIEGKTCL
jgi:hypothetical protein